MNELKSELAIDAMNKINLNVVETQKNICNIMSNYNILVDNMKSLIFEMDGMLKTIELQKKEILELKQK